MTSDFISGIYNYCDYWCDRCAFTRRCRNFAMGEELKEEGRGKGRSDEENACFWNSVNGTLARAREQLDALSASRFADEFWDDCEEPDEDEMKEFTQRDEAERNVVKAHPLSVIARNYFMAVRKWLESSKPDIATAVENIVAQARCEVEATAGDARKEFDELEEMIEVVTWYHTLLYPKTGRFLHDILRDGPASGLCGEDTLGTAKLILVSADRSISAWKRILEHLPSQETHILRFLIMLDRLRRGIEKETPSARAYLRPGLDK